MEKVIGEILKKVHRKFAKDTEYPQTGSEDMLVRLDFVDDAIGEYEDCADEGYCWDELKTQLSFVFGGTGTDPLPDNFLSFIRKFTTDGFEKASFLIGNVLYQEINASEGVELEQQGYNSSNVFWKEEDNIRTLPALTGTYALPCLEKHPRYITGAETTPIKMRNTKFIEDYVLAKLYFDNADDDNGQTYIVSANDKLNKMKYELLS